MIDENKLECMMIVQNKSKYNNNNKGCDRF